MELALQNYERASLEATTELRAVWEVEKEKLSRERRILEEDRRRLELEAAEGAAEIARVEGTVVRPADRVLLDVGGTHFATTRRTLTAALTVAPDSLLGAMFSGRHEGRLQPDGEKFIDRNGMVFINRNGEMFEHILEFLRAYSSGDENASCAIRALPESQMVAMLHELEYYGLKSAIFPPVPYNIDLAAFSTGPEMLSKRWGFEAVVLPENRGVLVVGGQDDDGKRLASTELLDMEKQTFTPGPSMGSRRSYCGTVALEDSRVVVVGGSNGNILSTSEVLSPSTDTWSPGPNMASSRYGSASLPLSSARILVIGGASGYHTRTSLSTTEIIDLASGASTPGPEMSCPRFCCSAVMLHDGRVLVIGGRNSTTRSLSTTEILDLTCGNSSPGPEMGTPRRGASATLLPGDGGVLVIGGERINGTGLATTEVLDVTENTTSAGPELGIPRSYCVAAKLPGDRILVIGGYSDGKSLSTSEILGMSTE